MRALFGALAVLLGPASICLTARYGYKGADTAIDGVISAVVFGSIALCAFLFDAAAVRLWFMKHYVGSALDRLHCRRSPDRDLLQLSGQHRQPDGCRPGAAAGRGGDPCRQPAGTAAARESPGRPWQVRTLPTTRR